MTEVAVGFASFALALLLHVIWWRARPPKAPLAAFGWVFGASYLGAMLGYWSYAAAPSVSGCLYWTLLYGALMASYLLTYTAIAYDSPTLSLTYSLWKAGEAGMAREDLEAFIAAHPFVQTRMHQLYRDELVLIRDGRLLLAPKSKRLLRTYDRVQAILVRPVETG